MAKGSCPALFPLLNLTLLPNPKELSLDFLRALKGTGCLCGNSPGEVQVAAAALALRSPNVPGPRPAGGTVAEAAGGSHHRERDGWNEASEAELAGPPALGTRQATPTSWLHCPPAHVPCLNHLHAHLAASP